MKDADTAQCIKSEKPKKKYEVDMCNGPLLGKIIIFAIPLMLSSALQLAFNAADMIVVGRFTGSDALAAVGSTGSLNNLIINFFIGFVFAIYILLSKEKLGGQGKQILYALLSEKKADKVLEVCSISYRVFSRFLSGQCLEACILGALFVITMTIFRLPYAMLIGVLIGFCALIPIVGAFIGCGVGLFLILMVSPMKALVFLILFLVLQQLEGNLIYPKVVGNSVGLPSIWVLAAVTIGGNLMGVAGMLIFIPLCSVVYILFRMYRLFNLIHFTRWNKSTKADESCLLR